MGITEIPRGSGIDPAEGAMELRYRLKSGIKGNTGDGLFGREKEVARLLKTAASDIFLKGHSGGAMEEPGKVTGAESAEGGRLGEADLTVGGMFLDPAAGLEDRTGHFPMILGMGGGKEV